MTMDLPFMDAIAFMGYCINASKGVYTTRQKSTLTCPISPHQKRDVGRMGSSFSFFNEINFNGKLIAQVEIGLD